MKVLKILGLIVASFGVVFGLVFFLYPYINKEKYDEIMTSQAFNESDYPMRVGEKTDEELFLEFRHEIDMLRATNQELLLTIDSLELIQEDLRLEIEEWEKMEDFFPVSGNLTSTQSTQQNETDRMGNEEFVERVKSLLNLDEEELAPIVSEMAQEQLVRIFHNSGSIQREKLLRSLEPKRAAELVKEVM
ncbi:MAG: hypothetical protein WD097_03740 [Balneolales bacterium]